MSKEDIKIIYSILKEMIVACLIAMPIIIPLAILFDYLTKDFDKNIVNICLFLFLILIAIREQVFNFYRSKEDEEQYRKEIYKIRFGKYYTTNLEQLTFFDKIKTVFLVFVGFLTFSLLCLSIYSIYLLYSSFDKKIDTSIASWGATGDYIGGVTGTILSSIACCITLFMLYQQQKQIKISQNEIKQQQFETTFFGLLEKINQHKNDDDLTQFYLLLRLIYARIKEYSNNNSEIEETYNDIVKAHMDWAVLYKIIPDIPSKHRISKNELYFNIWIIIEEYALFEYIPVAVEVIRRDLGITTDGYRIDIKKIPSEICYYKISAFEGNNEVMPMRISVENNIDELKKYSMHPEKVVRLAIAENKYTAKETLILLSQDSEEEVRQAAVNNENLKVKV